MLFPIPLGTIQLDKSIAEEQIELYDFKWLDTSAIPIFNLAQ